MDNIILRIHEIAASFTKPIRLIFFFYPLGESSIVTFLTK